MKRQIALLMAIALVIVLFAGCGNNTPGVSPTDAATPEATDAPQETAAPEPAEPAGDGNNYAVGKYETDSRGFPLAKYDYELPLTTSEEVFTYFCVCWQPQYLPEEGIGGLPAAISLAEQTGVNVEYVAVSNAGYAEQFSVRLAADDLCDMTSNGMARYPGTVEEALFDGQYYVNIYDYKEYCPNFIYEAAMRNPNDNDTYKGCFYADDIIPSFTSLKNKGIVEMAGGIRADWLERIGWEVSDLVTFDDLKECLTLFKTEIDTCSFPWAMINVVESLNSFTLNAFDTEMYVSTKGELPLIHQVDGVAQFSLTTENDLDLLTYLNDCYAEGLIHPQFAGFASNSDYNEYRNRSEVGYMSTSPAGMAGFAATCTDPNCDWEAVGKLVRYEGQVLHLGAQYPRATLKSGVAISTKCENLPLVMTYCDWCYSDAGSFEIAYGLEDYTYSYDEGNELRLTDLMLKNELGLNVDWAFYLYTMAGYMTNFVDDTAKKFKFDGGQKYIDMFDIWSDFEYDGAYAWPAGLNLNSEQTASLQLYQADISTYISETICEFIDGSKPLSDWNSYLSTLSQIGIDECLAVYQEAYDAFMAE